MHEIAHALIEQEEEGEEGDLEQEQGAALAAVALMIIGAEESPRLCAECRQPSRLSVSHSFFQILVRIPHGRCITKVTLIAPSSPPWDLMWMPSRML